MELVPAPPDVDFTVLKHSVGRLLHFDIDNYKDSFLQRRFNTRIKAHHLSSYHDYLSVLKNSRAEQEHLRKELTVNVTEFFRDAFIYTMLQDHILPECMSVKDTVHIWSAGCADGKEAYSIAIIVNELLKSTSIPKTVTILGTDIDTACLEQAKAGVYLSIPSLEQTDIAPQLQFINCPEEYFDIRGETYVIKPVLKKLVQFSYHDLTSPIKDDMFDIIFCRNVMIYFTRGFQEELCHRFYQVLYQDGYLFLGSSETLPSTAEHYFTSYDLKQKIYKKK